MGFDFLLQIILAEKNLWTEKRAQVGAHLGRVGAAATVAGEELAPQQLLSPGGRGHEGRAVRDGQLLALVDVPLGQLLICNGSYCVFKS